MTSHETADAVRRIIADLFQIDPAELGDDASPETVEAWDSLQHVNLVLDLESHFGIQLSEDQIEAMTDVASVIEIVRQAGG